jgi:uncharacterized membrane protein
MKDMRSRFTLGFVGATVSWVILLSLAPILPTPVAAMTYALGSFICHQRPERSFHSGVVQLPVCARCIGIYAGAALASLGWTFMSGRFVGRHPPCENTTASGRRGLASTRLLLLAAIPTAITLVLEWVGIWQPSNVVRAAAGIPLGFAAALVVIGALTTLHYDECARRPPIGPPPQRTRI